MNFVWVLLPILFVFIDGKVFPLHEFYNLTKDTVIPDPFYLCGGRSSSSDKCCNCEDTCFYSRTCCIDKLWKENEPIPLDEYIEKFLARVKATKTHVCEPVLADVLNTNRMKTNKLMMVRSCTDRADAVDRKHCLEGDASFEDNMAVFGSDNLLYRSAACARCNSVENYNTVGLYITCKDGPDDPSFTNSSATTTSRPDLLNQFKRCDVSLAYNKDMNLNNYISTCETVRKLDNRCPKSNPLHDRCNAYMGVYLDVYENFDCNECENGPFLREASIAFSAFKCTTNNIVRPGTRFTWSLTLQFKTSTEVSIRNIFSPVRDSEDKNFCPAGYVYDLSKGSCVKFTCGRGYTVENDKCVRMKAFATVNKVSFTDANFDKCLASLQKNAAFIPLKNQSMVSAVRGILELNPELNVTNWALYKTTDNKNVYYNENINTTNLKPFTLLQPYEVIVASKTIRNTVTIYDFEPSRYYPNGRICADIEYLDFVLDGNFTETCRYLKKNVTYVNFVSWIRINASGSHRYVSVCRQFHLDSSCTRKEITDGYEISSNRSLIVKTIGGKAYMFTPDKYVPTSKGVAVCHTKIDEKGYQWQSTLNDIEYYISIILTSISIACYVVIIAVYLYFPELKKIPSLNATALCTVLLITDMVFIAVTQIHNNATWCEYLAVVLHWSLLAVQTWSVIIAVVFALNFRSINRRNVSMKRFYAFCGISFVIPTVIVTLSVILDTTGVVDFGYGDNGVCWIGEFYPRLIAFIIPVSASFLASLIALLFTVHYIDKRERSARKVLAGGRKMSVNVWKVSLKLVAILGTTEILGMIQITSAKLLTENETIFNAVFAFVYSLARSLRGLFLFVVYICTSHVFRLLQKKLEESSFAWTKNTSSTSAGNSMALASLNSASTPQIDLRKK